MPELPEVETIRRTIWPQLTGRTIERVDVIHKDVVAGVAPEDFASLLTGKRPVDLDRRGKYLILTLDPPAKPGSPPLRVLIHLRMTGRLGCVPRGAEAPSHTHLRFALSDGKDLLFTDPRRFGRWTLLDCPQSPGAPKGFSRLGPEPLGPSLTGAEFAAGLAKRRGKLKSVLLDQCFVAGIGNIYADEIMYRARLHPLRTADALTPPEIERLYAAMRWVLSEAIGKGGTTIRNYVDGSGRKGDFVYSLCVYGRTGEECATGCGAKIERIVVGGRSTHFCPRCQPSPEASCP